MPLLVPPWPVHVVEFPAIRYRHDVPLLACSVGLLYHLITVSSGPNSLPQEP